MNWPKIIRALEKSGLTQAEIARLCESSQPYIAQLKLRRRLLPNYTIGKRLVDLHAERCPPRQEAA